MSRVVHFDMMAKEPPKAIEFYSKVFGWKFEKWNSPGMDYWLIMTGDAKTPGIDGGLAQGDQAGMMLNTIDVVDLDGALRKIQAGGGKVVMQRGAIPGVGWYARFEDPSGNQFGLMQADTTAK
jgi:predicted enzyme related to lactoylglutathione lyase